MGMLDGKTAIVTGASSGIGHAAARLFAAEGANVVINARRGAMQPSNGVRAPFADYAAHLHHYSETRN